MKIYPYSSPIILTDSLYITYGGLTGTATAFQRQAAYLLAEMAVSEELDTLLLPTIVTGSYFPQPIELFFLADYAHIRRFIQAREFDFQDNVWNTFSGPTTGYINIRDYTLGQIDYTYHMPVYKLEYVCEYGLSSGTSYQPNIMLALTSFANIMLNEMIGYGNEAVGDIGVQDFSNQSYRESRVKLLRTTFGTSAKAQFIQKLLTPYKLFRWGAKGL